MKQKILVAGLFEDAGKTTFACSLISYLKENNFKAGGFKPKAGNSFWFDYSLIYNVLKQGRLYGKDALMLKKYSETNLSEETLNPYHRLYADQSFWKNKNQFLDFLADRISLDDKKIIIINKARKKKYKNEDLTKNLADNQKNIIKYVHNINEYNSLLKENYYKAFSINHKKILKNFDTVIYESYSNAALPWNKKSSINLNIVFLVEPGCLYVYDGKKYLDGVKMVHNQEISTQRAVEFLKPFKKIKIPPYPKDPIINMKNSTWMKKIVERFINE